MCVDDVSGIDMHDLTQSHPSQTFETALRSILASLLVLLSCSNEISYSNCPTLLEHDMRHFYLIMSLHVSFFCRVGVVRQQVFEAQSPTRLACCVCLGRGHEPNVF